MVKSFLVWSLLRIANAFGGSFIGVSLGSDADAGSFHFRATKPWYDIVTQGNTNPSFRPGSYILDGSQFYIKILETIYNIFGPHIFVGNLLSCFVWYLSAKVLIKVSYMLRLTKTNQTKNTSCLFFLTIINNILLSYIKRAISIITSKYLDIFIFKFFFKERYY